MPDEPELLAPRTLRQRIGGRWAVAWQSYLITAALGLLALLAGEQHALESPSTFFAWLGLSVAGTLALGALLVVVDFTVFAHRRTSPVPVWAVVAVDGVFGVVYSLVVGFGAQRLGLQTDSAILERTFVNALYAMWWGPTLSYFLDYREQAQAARRAVIAEAVGVELIRLQQGELVERMRDELRAEVDSELDPARREIDTLVRSLQAEYVDGTPDRSEGWESMAEVFRGTATNAVRPLSARLWRETEARYPQSPWWSLPVNIVRHQPFRPLAFAVVDVLGTLSVQVRVFGLAHALVLLTVGLAVTVSIMLVANPLMRRWPTKHAQIFLVSLVFLQTTVVVRTQLREAYVPGSAPVSWQVTQVLAGILVVFVTSGFGAWRTRDEAFLANLRSDIEHEHVVSMARSRQMALVAREMAQVLHGTVQGRLLACALLLEDGNRSSDDVTLNATLASALDALRAPTAAVDVTGSLLEEVNRKVALWEGFCQIDVQITEVAARGSDGGAAGRIVEEGISNAIRHGKATCIDIAVDLDTEGALQILVVDNGIGPQHGVPGLGSAYLQQATGGRWSLTAMAPGTRLEAHVHS